MRIAAGVAFALLLAACAPAAPAPGAPTAIPAVCNQPDGTRVRLTGYLRFRPDLHSTCGDDAHYTPCDLKLYAASPSPEVDEFSVPPVRVNLLVPAGSRPGRMTPVAEGRGAESVHLHVLNGRIVGEGAKVTVDGVVRILPTSAAQTNPAEMCFVAVDWAQVAP